MKISRSAVAATLALAVVAQSTGAQTLAPSDSLSLQGRTILALGIGLSGARDSRASAGEVSAHATGQVASFAFTHFVRPELAVEIATAVLDADSFAGFGRVQNDAIVPLLFGLSYSPRALALSTALRPFFSAAAGPYFHNVAAASGFDGASASARSVMGGRVGTGVNWYVARHFIVQIEGDYHLVGKMEPVNGVTKDPSGFAMSFGMGIAWGGR